MLCAGLVFSAVPGLRTRRRRLVRRRIARQLNRGENLHALRRELVASAGEGAVRRRHHEQLSEQMWCLTATNAIAIWTTEYSGLAVTARRRGRPAH
ncbi:Tn3 family transposase [Streptomyces sp. NPDC005373]|uniref:Tn3 family transposase n=1 Tax=Streptomyces sp. NPDC005373 TaxID=3156879 RepID=UPI0033BC3983